MADVKTIRVENKPLGAVGLAIRHGIVWSYLIAAEAASHLLFGGSWVIDVMVLAGLTFALIGKALSVSGTSIEMTKAEIRLWVAAGMPDDIKAWRETQKIRVA